MLHQTVVSTPHAGIGWGTLRKGLFVGPGAWLAQLVLVFTIACILACAYLWQSTAIAEIEADTARTRRALQQLEQENVALMVQVAQWNSPAYIEERARRNGWVPAATPIILETPLPTVAEEPQSTADWVLAEIVALWHQLLDNAAEPVLGLPQAAAWMR